MAIPEGTTGVSLFPPRSPMARAGVAERRLSSVGGEASARTRLVVRLQLINAHALVAATAVLLLPNALFALHLQPLAAAVTLLGVIGTALLALRSVPQDSVLALPLAPLRLMACVAAASTLLVLGGEGHLVFSNYDWLFRDAVLSDVSRAPFPPAYAVDGSTALLRAPLGIYMLPALVASKVGLGWGHATLLAQNTTLLALVLYMMATLSGRNAGVVCTVFVLFSGLDIVGEAIMRALGPPIPGGVLPSHLEAWMPGLQYSSVVTQLFWVPNHALPSYWLALLAWACRRGDVPLGLFVASSASSLFWSPFAVMGALPLGLYLFARPASGFLSSGLFWGGLAAAACFAPVALYLQADAADVPHRFLFLEPDAYIAGAVFLLVEIPQAVVVFRAWSCLPPDLRKLAAVSIGFLVVLPIARLGQHNDLVMRASIPGLTLLAVAFAHALRISRTQRRTDFTVALILVGLGAVTPAMELARAFAFTPFAISDCNVITVWKKLEPDNLRLDNYLARPSPTLAGLFGLPSTPSLAGQPASVCWPDLPVDPRLNISHLSNAQLLLARQQLGPPGL